jgi:hypothetical protein
MYLVVRCEQDNKTRKPSEHKVHRIGEAVKRRLCRERRHWEA